MNLPISGVKEKTALLTTAYWPNIHYFSVLLHAKDVMIEAQENYQRQTNRNRCTILTASGPLNLIVPIKKTVSKKISEIEISYAERWQMNHWRSIFSAYGKAPYFEFFSEDISSLYQKRFVGLLEFNLAQLNILLKILRLKKQIQLSEVYVRQPEHLNDFRQALFNDEYKRFYNPDIKYRQIFTDRYEFQKNVSVLDILFCEGLNVMKILESKRS